MEMDIVEPDHQFMLFLDDVRLPADALVGQERSDPTAPQDAALAQLFAGLNPERILGAAMAVGMGRYALDRAVEYANQRSVWKTTIGAHQGIAHPLAQVKIEIELAKTMMQKAAVLYDSGDDVGAAEAANMAKYAAAEASIKALDQAIQTHGGAGFSVRVRSRLDAGRRPDRARGPRQSRDDPQLRGAAFARPAEVVLR